MFDNQKELITLITTLSNVENLDKKTITRALEKSLSVGIRKDFPKDTEVVIEIGDKGEAKLYKVWTVVDDNQLDFSDSVHVYEDVAQEKFSKDLVIGDKFKEEITDYSFKRINASIVRQLLKKHIKEAHDSLVKLDLMNQEDNLIQVVVKKYDKNGYVVEYNNEVTGFLPYDNLFNSNEKIKVGSVVLVSLDHDSKGFQNFSIVFTRKSNDFIKGLFSREVSEVYDEVIEVRSISKNLHKKTIVAVSSNDNNIDPVGCCIGARGLRIQNISKQLNGEKLEIVRWHSDPIEMILEVSDLDIERVIIEDEKITLILTDECYGKNNVAALSKTLSNLTLKKISLQKLSDFETQDSIENKIYSQYFMDSMNLDLDSANYLIELGLFSIDDIYSLSTNEAVKLGLDKGDFETIKDMAFEAIKSRKNNIENSNTNLVKMNLLNEYMIDMLLKNNITSQEDLADLSNLELIDIVPVDRNYASQVILQARESWN